MNTKTLVFTVEIDFFGNGADTVQRHGMKDNDLAIKTAFLIKSKISEIQSSQQTQHQHKQNRYSLYRSLDSSIVLKYPAIAITIKAIYKSSF